MTHVDEEVGEVWEDLPERGRRRRWGRLLVGLLAIFLVLLGVAGLWLKRQLDPPGGPGARVSVSIQPGTSLTGIANLLQREGVVTSARVFRLYTRATGAGPFEAGDYTFRARQRMSQVVDILDRGPTLSFVRLTIPEGYTLEQIARKVGQLPGRTAERFLAAARSGQVRSKYEPPGSNDLEGLLQPETYTVDRKKDDEVAILRRMVQAFDAEADALDLSGRAAALSVSPYQVVIVGSLVEREAKVATDRAPIARVIYNRLGQRFPLGIDASDRYGLHKPTGSLTKSDLARARQTPYSTRDRAGLPPTPIASPGRAALDAAASPVAGPWLYYVLADESGRHAFATTPAEFSRLKAEAKAKGLL